MLTHAVAAGPYQSAIPGLPARGGASTGWIIGRRGRCLITGGLILSCSSLMTGCRWSQGPSVSLVAVHRGSQMLAHVQSRFAAKIVLVAMFLFDWRRPNSCSFLTIVSLDKPNKYPCLLLAYSAPPRIGKPMKSELKGEARYIIDVLERASLYSRHVAEFIALRMIVRSAMSERLL
jgi:hypothetical protein